MINLKLSVHQLVDFLLRRGDIDNRIYNRNTMLMGSKIHAYYQAKQNNEYLSEYALEETFCHNDFAVTLNGRADGIIVSQDGTVTIDEIKSTVQDLEEFYNAQSEWHLGQAKCYALMFAHEKNLKIININLAYISQITETQIQKHFTFLVSELERYIDNLLDQYLNFYTLIYQKKIRRNNSANQIGFPFSEFRQGQKELAQKIYPLALHGGQLFVEAPTGIGKTMSTLYPYVKSFKEGENEKIFYLTAKTSGRESAFKAVEILKSKGLETSEILITAKDKICLNPGKQCNPDQCPYTCGYYDKLQNVLVQMLINETSFDFDTVLKYAIENDMCPFELELDLSLYVDIIICDYNYLFDPSVYMKRYFDEDCSHYITLIDEAHNLVERSRDMYSSDISYGLFLKAKKGITHLDNKKVKTAVSKLNKAFKNYLTKYDEIQENIRLDYLEDDFVLALNGFFKAGQEAMKDYRDDLPDEFVDFFFDVNKFIKLLDVYGENFRIFLTFENEKEYTVNLVCVDASIFVKQRLNLVKSAVIFSATLSPIDYYIKELGGNEDSQNVILKSPFPKENQLILVQTNISTKFANRDSSYEQIVESINIFVSQKKGNYFVFFPSYQYLEEIVSRMNNNDDYVIYEQNQEMNDAQKKKFLDKFQTNPSKTTLGFVVLGGTFSEGIDLLDDRLIGAIIVGVGLPKINFRSDLIKEYHDQKGEFGFNFAYVNIGINRVMQALGRVIRSETDKGAILLIDERYRQFNYKKMFKGQLSNYQYVNSSQEIQTKCEEFWKEK